MGGDGVADVCRDRRDGVDAGQRLADDGRKHAGRRRVGHARSDEDARQADAAPVHEEAS